MSTWTTFGRTIAPIRSFSLGERYLAGSGLTITLTAIVLLAVTWPIFDARWVAMAIPVPVVALLGLGLASYSALAGPFGFKGHALATGIGLLMVFLTGAALVPGEDIYARTAALAVEVMDWVRAIPTDEARSGLPQFAMLMSILAWVLGYGGGWLTVRQHQAWPLVLVGALVLLLVLSNLAGARALNMAAFMAGSALLLIHISTVRRLVIWRRKRLSFDPVTVLSQSGFMLVFGLTAVLIASVVPTPQAAPLRGLVSTVDRTVDAFQLEVYRLFSGVPSRLSFRTLTFEDQTVFRGNPNVTERLLFTVSGERGTYWRAKAYDVYTGRGWEVDRAEFRDFPHPENTQYQLRVENEHYFRITDAATDTLFTGGLPVAASEPAEGLAFSESPSDILQLRFTQGRAFYPTRANLRYTSTGSESTASPEDLRNAGNDYPADLLWRYTQLPFDQPARVWALALTLTWEYDNAYDKAQAIRRYLSSLPYDLEIRAPPPDRDGVDYFLFDLRRGYCDYYASAMAVMLRSLEIPARYVQGYTSGAFDPNAREYRVRELNYHAWVEAYFPEYGWIPFEPTPPSAISFRGPGNVPINPPVALLDDREFIEEEEEEENGDWIPAPPQPDEGLWSTVGPILLALLAGLAAVSGASWYFWWWRLGELERADALYAKMLRLCGVAGLARRPGQTPHEYAAALGQQMPDNAEDIRSIARVYAESRYSQKLLPISELRRAEEAWERLRWVLIRRVFGARPA